MTGSMALEMDLSAGGAVDIVSLDFDGYIAPSKSSAQWINGVSSSGTYAASAASNWAFQASFDWSYNTPCPGMGGTDIIFDNYQWNGFIIPVSELTIAGMSATALDDPLGYFGGASSDFESWLLGEVAPRLPAEATHLLFVQGEAHPDWTNPDMGMTTDGIVGETIIGYVVPEPGTMLSLLIGFCAWAAKRSWTYRAKKDR
ncbi:MAG: PEP-CTERM sorting domain-containing protein [Desulfobacteraceae bacterium]|nr:PEP-CTERM sorting domain-containing protein [Desulfobacteraceae bacterium]